jgi:Secretion system C-terminal sorting domain
VFRQLVQSAIPLQAHRPQGASTYRWNTGATTAAITIAPPTTTSYTVTGTNNNSCSNVAIAKVTVNPKPIVTVNNATICSGLSTTLTANGASTYRWNTGATTAAITVAPTTTTSYTVTGTNNTSCSNVAIAKVTVNPKPTVSISSTKTSSCFGTANCYRLTATGAGTGGTYTWYRSKTLGGPWGSSIGTGNIINVSRGWYYMVIGRTASGCTNNNTTSVARTDEDFTVNPEAIIDLTKIDSELALFPNPNNGNMTLTYTISDSDKGLLMIYDLLGRVLSTYTLDPTLSQLQINNDELSNGTYVYTVIVNDAEVHRAKIVILK